MKSKEILLEAEEKRVKRILSTPEGNLETNMPRGAKTPEEVFSRLEKKASLERQASKGVGKGAQAALDAGEAGAGVAQSRRALGTSQRAAQTKPETKPRLQDTTKGGPVRTMRLGDPGAPSKEAAKTLQRMTTADKSTATRLQSNLRRTDTAAKSEVKKPKVVKQAEVSVKTKSWQKKFKKELERRRAATTKRPTVKQMQQFTAGRQKGYISKHGTPTAKGIDVYATRSATRGYGDAGYDASKRGVSDPAKEISKTKDLSSRAASGDKSARSLVKRTYKKMTARYPDRVIDRKSFRDFSREAGRTPSTPTRSTTATRSVSANPQPPKSTPSAAPKISSPSGGPSKPSVATATKVKQSLKLAIAPPPEEPTKVSTGTTKTPRAKVTKSTVRPTDRMSGISPRPTTVKSTTTVKLPNVPKQPVAPKPQWKQSLRATPSNPQGVPSDVMKQFQQVGYDRPGTSTAAQRDRTIQRVRNAVSSQQKAKDKIAKINRARTAAATSTQQATKTLGKQTLKGLGFKGLQAVGAAYDVKQGYDASKAAGGSNTRAVLRGISRAAGGLLGGAAGGALGSSVGPVGTFAGGAVGYDLGAKGADRVFKTVAGATKAQKTWMRTQNRLTQGKGTSASDVKYRVGNKAVITDPRTGKERVGYLAKSQGKDAFYAPNTTRSLSYTSSNPLERVGRTISRTNLGPVSDWFKSRYAAKDEATRKRSVAALKAASSK